MSQIISYSNSVSEYKIIEKNGNSKYPKLKNTAVIVIAIAITSANISINRSNQLNISSKSKNDTLSISNIIKSKFETFPNIENSKEEDKMSDFKLNEVQKYFDEKISGINDKVHEVNIKVANISKDISYISKSIDNMPQVIKSTILETEKAKKEKFSDRYKAPVITGIVAGLLVIILQKLFKL